MIFSKIGKMFPKIGIKFPKVGMRLIKTGIAVALCALIGKHIGIGNLFSASIGCIMSLQDTIRDSLRTGINRFIGIIIGGVIGLLVVIIRPGDPILSGVGVVVVIYACNIFNIKSPVAGMVTFLTINTGVGESNPLDYSTHRMIDSSFGVLCALAVNYIMARPNYLSSTLNDVNLIEKKIFEWVKLKIIEKKDIDASDIENTIKKLDATYSKYLHEFDYGLESSDLFTLEELVNTCRKMYHHAESICLLEDNLYLEIETYNSLKEMYKKDKLDWVIEKDRSPVFNFHLMKIMDEYKSLNSIKSKD